MRTKFKMTQGQFETKAKAKRRGSIYERLYARHKHEIDERIEDAELNAIADERAEGPFVKVSLDDL